MPDELSLDEAYRLCDDLAALGLEKITLSGGEPFTHPDWHRIARRLWENHIACNVISNGWLIDDELLDKAFAAGIENIAVSVDGYKDTHDLIRRKGSWDRLTRSLALMKKRGMSTAVSTCINKKNITELKKLKKVLAAAGVARWQFQIAHPMGNLLDNPELVVRPEDLPKVAEFAVKTAIEGKLVVDLGDDLGYYTKDSIFVRSCSAQMASRPVDAAWQGCQAGKYVLGIRANGDITGCLSIRDDSFIEDNIRKTPLKTIWSRPGAFAWNRNFSANELEGFCAHCRHADVCQAGCTGCKITFEKSLTQNSYCMYRLEMKRYEEKAASIKSVSRLEQEALTFIRQSQYQRALIYLNQAGTLAPDRVSLRKHLGYVYFMLGRFEKSLAINEAILAQKPDDIYCRSAKGICLARLGHVNEGIAELLEACDLTTEKFMDPFYDLAVVYYESGNYQQALDILDRGSRLSDTFHRSVRSLYQSIRSRKLMREDDAKRRYRAKRNNIGRSIRAFINSV